MEILKQLPADVQCTVLRSTPITRQLASLHRLPVELHCMRSERHIVAILLVQALWGFMLRHTRSDVISLYLNAADDFIMWRRSDRKRLVDFNRRHIERLVKSGVDFYDALGCEEVTNFRRTLDDDWEEYRDWVASVVHDEVDPSSEQPTS